MSWQTRSKFCSIAALCQLADQNGVDWVPLTGKQSRELRWLVDQKPDLVCVSMAAISTVSPSGNVSSAATSL